jgi:multiple antibiotic resistance protein
MLELALVSFTTFFTTIGPVEAAVVYAGLSSRLSAAERWRTALRGVAIAAFILLLFALFGQALLDVMGISLPALRAAGGVLLLLLAIELVFGLDSGATTATADETDEARHKADISVFPLAMPLIAGPGAMGAAMLMMADAGDDLARQGVVVGMLFAVHVLTLVLLLLAGPLQRVLGVTGTHVVNRISGVLLAALAMQFLFDGLAGSGVFHPA